MGATLFAVKNASLYCKYSLPSTTVMLILLAFPHWSVSLTGASESSTAQWIAKGDEAMENVVVNWGGFCVGRISCPSKLRKHTVCSPKLADSPRSRFADMTSIL